MGMEIDQARQHPFARPIDQPSCASCIHPRVIAYDLAVGERQQPIVRDFAASGVDQMPRAQLYGLGSCRGGHQRHDGRRQEGSDHRP